MEGDAEHTMMVDTLADDFRTAMTLQVPGGSTGRLSDSDMGDSGSLSSRGGSERGYSCMPKISVMRLGDDINTNEERTAHGSSINTISVEDGCSYRGRSASEASLGRLEGVPGIIVGTLGEDEE